MPTEARVWIGRSALALLAAVVTGTGEAPAQAAAGVFPESQAIQPASRSVPPESRSAPPAVQRQTVSGAAVYRVPVTGVIELGLAPFISRSISQAEEEGAAAVVLDIDTPGGRVDAAERIADAIQDASIPVYAYVNRRAFSAGALISLAADEILMLPGSVIGAATPVDGSGERAPEKIVSAMRSEMRALAEARGLDPRIAEAMVDENIEVPDVIAAGSLLTLTTDEAVDLGYATRVESWTDALETVGLSGAPVAEMEVNWAERMVRFFTHPAVSPFLLSLGFLGLLIEIKSPGLGLAGATGVIALGLFFGSHHLLGLAGLEDMLIFGFGLVLVAVEVFLIPGFGLFGLLGGLGILGGLYLSLLGSLPTMPDLAQAGGVLTVTLLLVLVTAWTLVRRIPGSGRLARSGVFLLTRTERDEGYESALRRPELVGKVGVAATDLRPAGTGLFDDERLDVVAESQWIEEGTPIRVVFAEGYRHVVRAVEMAEDVDREPVPEGSAPKGSDPRAPGTGGAEPEGPSESEIDSSRT